MKILVTGGAGFIGYTTCNYLLNKGYEVIAFDNLSRKGVEHNLEFLINKENFTFIKGDVTNTEDVNLLKQYKIDGIIHLAANPAVPTSLEYPLYDFNINALGTVNMLEYARQNGKIPFILASTNKVYSDVIDSLPIIEKQTRYEWGNDIEMSDISIPDSINELFPLDGKSHSPYGCSKLTADIYAREYYHTYGVPTVVNRMSCIYGPHQMGKEEQGWVAWFCIAKIMGLPITIFGDGKQVRDCLYGEDLAELYELQLRNIETFKGNVYNVGGGLQNTTSLLEFINIIDKNFSKIGSEEYKKLEYKFEDWRQADQKIYISDISKISKYWQPKTNLLTGITKIIDWVKENKSYIPIN